MRIGIICPSEIALRRFMPALQLVEGIEFAGIAVNSPEERFGINMPGKEVVDGMLKVENEKAKEFLNNYGGKFYTSYEEIINSEEIDALYIPLPPALHYKWAKKALESGKHVLLEKPSTINLNDTKDLVNIAEEKGLALHENYMFNFHSQLDAIEEIITNGELGDVRLYRISFGFPMRASNDFRYVKALGGGALLDAGGYTIKYADRLLGSTAKVAYAHLNYLNDFEVDMYGSGALVNEEGVTAQISFGMDNSYKCELEVWGSKGCLTTNRVLTAPVGFEPVVTIVQNNEEKVIKLESDDTFKKSIEYFSECVNNIETREESYKRIVRQSELVDQFNNLSK